MATMFLINQLHNKVFNLDTDLKRFVTCKIEWNSTFKATFMLFSYIIIIKTINVSIPPPVAPCGNGVMLLDVETARCLRVEVNRCRGPCKAEQSMMPETMT